MKATPKCPCRMTAMFAPKAKLTVTWVAPGGGKVKAQTERPRLCTETILNGVKSSTNPRCRGKRNWEVTW